MSDAALDLKCHDLMDPILGTARSGELIALARRTATLPNVRELVSLTRP
jgi:hypothetical protein